VPRNTDARLDRATVRPGLELAGLSTLQHDRLVCGVLPSAVSRSSCAPRLGGSDSRRPLAHLRAQANRAHLPRRTDHRHEPHPLSLIRHRDQLLAMSASAREAGHPVELPADHPRVLATIAAKGVLAVAGGLDALARGNPMVIFVEPDGRGDRPDTLSDGAAGCSHLP